jgi:hypothetical protein
MDGYNPKSCNALEKPFYRPIEAAIRWCGLVAHEAAILQAMGSEHIPQIGQFPRWPCLHANTLKIFDAIANGDMPCGRDGRTVDDHVAPARRTVRHTDLREWMSKHYPDQKPAFLFDELERGTHSAISIESYRILKAAHDANERKLSLANERIREAEEAKRLAETERDALRAMVDKASAPGERAETTYLNIIGAMVALMLSNTPEPNSRSYSVFDSQAAIIAALLGHHEGKPGISARTLEEKFAAAKRSLAST